MKRLKAFGVFWYNFIIGDDWKLALGSAVGLGASAAVVHVFRVSAWWILPLVVVATLAISVRLSISTPRSK